MWESLFTPEVIGARITGLFSSIATLISLRANSKSDRVSNQSDRVKSQLLELRLEPYKELRSLAELPVPPSEKRLTLAKRKDLHSKFRSWYYQNRSS